MLDELDAGTLLERLGIPRAPSVALDADITQRAGPAVSPIRSRSRRSRPRSRTRPMSAASCSASPTARRCSRRSQQIRANVAQRTPGTHVARVLVQPMVARLGEVLVGYRVDPRRRPAGDGRGRRRAHRDRARPQPAARAGRSRDRARDDRRGARPRGARRLPRPARGRSRRAGAGDRRDVAACATIPRSPRPRSIR